MTAVQRLRQDDGVSLIESIIALAVIGTCMAALTAFSARSMAVIHQQGNAQQAAQFAIAASEKVRGLHAGSLAEGRGSGSTATQWSNASAGVLGFLPTMQKVWDSTVAPSAGRDAPLPSTPQPYTRSGVTYVVNYYLGACWIQPTDLTGYCGPAEVPGAGALHRVIVETSWSGCGTGACSYVTSFLVSTRDEPLFS